MLIFRKGFSVNKSVELPIPLLVCSLILATDNVYMMLDSFIIGCVKIYEEASQRLEVKRMKNKKIK